MRVCDILGAYALQLLRGETDHNTYHCKALLQLFEIVYIGGEFLLSKAALMCISSTLERHTDFDFQHRRIRTVRIPRWAAHALFPEFSCALDMRCGDVFSEFGGDRFKCC